MTGPYVYGQKNLQLCECYLQNNAANQIPTAVEAAIISQRDGVMKRCWMCNIGTVL